MNDAERDIHQALDRLVRAAPPPLNTPAVLAAGRRARRRRSVLTAGGAVGGVVAVVAAAAVMRSALPDSGTGGVTPAVSSPTPATSAPAAGAEGWQQPPVPGLSPADARRIARGCAESYGGRGGRIGTGTPVPDPSVTPRPQATLVDDPSAPLLADVVRLHNVVRDEAGTMALLYGPGVMLTCSVDGAALPYNAGGSIGAADLTAWLPGPVAVDMRESSAGEGSGGKYPGIHGWDLVAGRIVSNAARVTVTYGSATATVPVVNGTYLVRFVRRVGAPIPAGDSGLTVRAYDAGGTLVGETGTSLADCYVTPGGTKISGDRTDPDQSCKPAVRWL